MCVSLSALLGGFLGNFDPLALTYYNKNARTWQEHTSTKEFAFAFETIMREHKEDNDKQAAGIEKFFIEEAQKIGVVKVSKARRYKNQNRYEK